MLRNSFEQLIDHKRFVFRVWVFVSMLICLHWQFLPASTASGAKGDGTSSAQLNKLNQSNQSEGGLSIAAKAVVPLDLYKKAWTIIKYCFYDQRFNGQEWSRWEHHYDGKLRTIDDAHLAIATMLASLNDPYTRFLDQSSFDQAVSLFNHGIFGVGMQLTMNRAHHVIVHAVIDGSPAFWAGVKSGDHLTEVDDKPIARQSLDAVVQQIRGKTGTKVTITVRRDEDPRELLYWARLGRPFDHQYHQWGEPNKWFDRDTGQSITRVPLTRAIIPLRAIAAAGILPGGIGYIRLDNLNTSTATAEMKQAVSKVSGTKGLVLDLRNCPGDESIAPAIDIASLFLRGKVVNTVEADGYRSSWVSHPPLYNGRLVVLINEGTSQFAEMLAAALQETGSASVVGQYSFGLPLIQSNVKFEDGSGMKVTIASWLTPHDHDIRGQGIKPDLVVPLSNDDWIAGKGPWWVNLNLQHVQRLPTNSKDKQLEEALDLIEHVK
jgi:carboxyl-terminal processing protease